MASAKEIRQQHERSTIFDSTPVERPVTSSGNRNNRTFQDSNIFGWKNTESSSITNEAKKTIGGSPNGKQISRDQPHLRKSIITEHHYNEAAEKAKEDRKLKRKMGASMTSEAFKETLSKIQGTPKDYAYASKQKELHGSIFDNPSIPDRSFDTSKTRSDLYSSSVKWNDQASQRKAMNLNHVKQDQYSQYAQARKSVEMHSDIFHSKGLVDRNHVDLDQSTISRPRSPGKPTDFTDKHGAEHRRKDQRYSDIFGSENLKAHNEKFTSSPKKKSLKIPTNTDWKDSKTEHMARSSTKGNLLTPAQMKQEHLKASMDSPERDRADTARELTSRDAPAGDAKSRPVTAAGDGKIQETDTAEFDIRGIPKNFDEDALKKMFSGYHIVDLKADSNKVNGKLLGSGKVKIRSENKAKIQDLKNKLKSSGITLLNHFEKVKRKNL